MFFWNTLYGRTILSLGKSSIKQYLLLSDHWKLLAALIFFKLPQNSVVDLESAIVFGGAHRRLDLHKGIAREILQ